MADASLKPGFREFVLMAGADLNLSKRNQLDHAPVAARAGFWQESNGHGKLRSYLAAEQLSVLT